ncbi:MAG: hypothetical protein R3B13_23095 [Polyangiaceae bacterium]
MALPFEHGSELTLPWLTAAAGVRAEAPWEPAGRSYGSGRDALRAVLRHGRVRHGWSRLQVPSYLCQEVVQSALEEIEVASYDDRPDRNEPRRLDARPGDVVLDVNYFGLREASHALSVPEGVALIEDHTHDPWSDWAQSSRADYAIASLRKTLPVPEGGVLWSPASHALPPELAATALRSQGSADKLAGMWLKSLYLAGHDVEKDQFRRLALSGEAHIADGEISGMCRATRALLPALPTETWRAQRQRNFSIVSAAASTWKRARLLAPTTGVPFCLAVVCNDAEHREAARSALIRDCIYPAVLWPLESPAVAVGRADVELSRRLLTLHCDYRYDTPHMQRVAERLCVALGEAS